MNEEPQTNKNNKNRIGKLILLKKLSNFCFLSIFLIKTINKDATNKT